ncbi:UBX domain-containing protein 4-like [Tropilaelaps mercedesae]|uniref:UBX domain-containing protein 4 n=1 Tax=Tropilaelaps mercedesae TaxID=418985 RepID=A0A1V9X8B9_9ACAR|nr:UBX domain-containing protein 4-like [Tropilaelaps mercedesae]
MNWFDGSIADAISAARRDDKIMTIYVYGDTSESEQVTSALSAPMLAPLVPHIVSLRLKQPSIELVQFSELYPVLLVPSIYFICPQTGVALGVLIGVQSAESLLEKITKILKSRELRADAPPPAPIPAATDATQAEEPVSVSIPSDSTLSEGTLVDMATEIQSEDMTTATEASLTVQEEVERAQRLIEAIRQEKARAQQEEERRKEIERREAMKNLQKIRRDAEDREIKNLIAEKNKEREEEKRYRAQLQEQIRQDRLERQQRFTADRKEDEEQARRKEAIEKQEEAERIRARNASSANILFRMPDGSTVTHMFKAETPFIEVRQYIADAKNLSGRFNLALNFPRRVFDTDCDEQTLRDLNLAPNAVLLVIAKSTSGRGAGAGSGSGAMTAWRNLWDMLTLPITLAMGFFTSFFTAFFSSAAPPAPMPNRVQQDTAVPSTSTSVPLAAPHDAPGASRTRIPGTGSSLRQRKPYERSGNIHRLNTDNDDSDNENNTWNGNSTQQM